MTNSEPKKISLTLPIEAVVKQRPRVGKWGGYTPARTRKFETSAALLARRALGPHEPLQGPLSLIARFIFAPPKKLTRSYPCKGDTSNFLKAIEDAMNGILWVDDVQIVHADARKFYDMSGGPSRIELEVCEVSP